VSDWSNKETPRTLHLRYADSLDHWIDPYRTLFHLASDQGRDGSRPLRLLLLRTRTGRTATWHWDVHTQAYNVFRYNELEVCMLYITAIVFSYSSLNLPSELTIQERVEHSLSHVYATPLSLLWKNSVAHFTPHTVAATD
jgi:hypothetical protein